MWLPKFSIIIPCYNNSKTLQRAIDSVINQDQMVHEIIVIDDGSTDETSKIAMSYGEGIIFLRQTNAGVSAARNRGVQIATGDWIAFLDADDVYTPDRISAHVSWLAQDPTFDFLLADQEARTPEGDLLRTFINSTTAGKALLKERANASHHLLSIDDFEALIADGYIEIRTLSLKRATFIDLGGFPIEHKIGEDLHFFIRLLAVSSHAGVIMRSLATYYIYPASALRADPLSTQIQFVKCVESLETRLKDAPSQIIRGWSHKRRACRLSLAYAYLRMGNKRSAIGAVWPLMVSNPTLRSLRDVLSILKGL